MEAYATADQVWAGGLIFARIGAVLMLIPGIGEAYVPPRVRLSLALLITLALWPVVRTTLPPLPESLASMVGWIIREAVVGLMIGLLLRMFMAALTTAGEIISLQTTLSFSQTANPMQAQPGTTIAAFLMRHPGQRFAARRVQIAEGHPFAEVRDNLIGEDMLPIDLMRCKLAFFGASRFDPRSDKWVRISMFQDMPYPDEMAGRNR